MTDTNKTTKKELPCKQGKNWCIHYDEWKTISGDLRCQCLRVVQNRSVCERYTPGGRRDA